jgi:hypothetical protein
MAAGEIGFATNCTNYTNERIFHQLNISIKNTGIIHGKPIRAIRVISGNKIFLWLHRIRLLLEIVYIIE